MLVVRQEEAEEKNAGVGGAALIVRMLLYSNAGGFDELRTVLEHCHKGIRAAKSIIPVEKP